MDTAALAAALLGYAEATLAMAPLSPYRSDHLFLWGLGVLMRDEVSDLAAGVDALDQSTTKPGATWQPSLFLALAELRRGHRRNAE